MTRPLRFTLFPVEGRCSQPGCFRSATKLGFCEIHHRHQVDAHHLALRRAGLHQPTPLCFPDQQAWVEYEVVAADLQSKRPANPCADCTPDYQREQIQQGKCDYPETVFVASHGGSDVEGINSDDFTRWVETTMGRTTKKVIGMPTAEARLAAIKRHEDEASKRTE